MDIVYIDGQIIDIDPNTSIAWTIQRVDIGDLSKNYASFSNTIKAGDTERNNRIFQNAKLDNSAGGFQYSFQDCKVVQNGIETIVGKAQITGFDGSYYTIVIYDSFVSLLSFLDGKDLSSIDFGSGSWSASAIDSDRSNTSGFVSAVMNWGRSSIYEANYFLPCYYYQTLIQKIFTGYSLSGSVLSSTDYTDLICTPITAFKYKDGFNNVNIPTTSTNNFFNASGFVDMTMPVQNVPFGIRANLKITVNFTSITFTKGGGSTSKVEVEAAGVTVGTFGTGAAITANTSGTFVYEFNDQTLITSQTITIRLRYTKDGAFPADNVTIITFAPSCKVEIVDTLKVVRTDVYWNRLANKKPLTSIVKDFFIRFGIVYKIEGNTISLKTLEEICTDTASAVDWSSKRVNKNKSPIDFKTSYAQSNYFLHEDDAKDKFLGSGNLAIANTTLQAAKDFFTSVFVNVKRWTGTGYEVMSTPAYDSTSTGIDDVKNEPPLMIGTLKSRTTEAAITFDATPRTDYKLAYHADASQVKDSSFRYFLSKYYPTLTLALQKNKVCKYQYNLNEMDIANYDPHKMIFDNGSYYLINKISNFRSGKITTVELFKIQ